MSAHPQLSFEDVTDMVKYILGTNVSGEVRKQLPASGSVAFTSHANVDHGTYIIKARYTDKGAHGLEPLSDSEVVRLRPAKMRPIDADLYVGIDRWRDSFSSAGNKSYLMLNNVDLTGLKGITYEYGAKDRSGEIQLRLNSLAGPVVASTPFKPTGSWDRKVKITQPLDPNLTGRHHLYLVIVSDEETEDDLVKLWSFEFNPL